MVEVKTREEITIIFNLQEEVKKILQTYKGFSVDSLRIGAYPARESEYHKVNITIYKDSVKNIDIKVE